jgi:hypothetical protein
VAQAPPAPRRHLATSPFRREEIVRPSTEGFTVGDRVTLDRYGMGRVVALDEVYLTVDFGEGVLRRLSPDARGLTVL